MYQIAIDPGLTATGWAVFADGQVEQTGTIWPKGDFKVDRLKDLSIKLRGLFLTLYNTHCAKPDSITVEAWETHSPTNRFQTMVTCAEARGIIMAISYEFSECVKYLSKGKASKAEAAMIVGSLGEKANGSEHARDAVHLGVLAGYCDRR
jgi:Holliday junction resolvasome RuvABC endonuclease subunit